MSERPRVTAHFERESIAIRRADGLTISPPGVSIDVDFDLHDHEAALRLLDTAVADVRAQIEATS